MGRLKRIAWRLSVCALFVAAVLTVAIAPAGAAESGTVVCVFEDGPASLSYAEAYSALSGIGENGEILLRDAERCGRCETGEAFRTAVEILRRGTLSDLLTLDMGGLGQLEHAAVMREFGGDVYYADGAFRIVGNVVRLSSASVAARVSLLAGALPAGYLKETGATALRLSSAAEFPVSALSGSNVSEIEAVSPYASEGGAVFRETAGGRRLIAAIPTARDLTVADCAYADRGALSACNLLRSLTLPFLGSAKSAPRRGDLRYLFETANGDPMPASLFRVTVLGGEIGDGAFYGCKFGEADLRAIPAASLSREAFAGASVERILCTRGDLALSGFRVSESGGVYTYEKESL